MSRQHVLVPIVSVALVLLLAGCDASVVAPVASDGIEVASALESTPSHGKAPLTGRCETSFMPHPTQPSPPLVRQIDQGTCRMPHLGKAAFYSVKELNFATGTQTTTEASFTAANGDILRATGSGTSAPIVPGVIGFTATLTFAGGTGRFEHATGEAYVQGEATLATGTATFEIISGHIDYDASDQRRR